MIELSKLDILQLLFKMLKHDERATAAALEHASVIKQTRGHMSGL